MAGGRQMGPLGSRPSKSNLTCDLVDRSTKTEGGHRGYIYTPIIKHSCVVIKTQNQTLGWQQVSFFQLSSLWVEADLQILCGGATERRLVCIMIG